MQTLTEEWVFGAKAGVRAVFVATDTGVAAVTVSAYQIGALGLNHRGATTAVSATASRLVVGTGDGPLAADIDAAGRTANVSDPAFESIGGDTVGSVTAADIGPEAMLVADTDGVVFRRKPGSPDDQLTP